MNQEAHIVTLLHFCSSSVFVPIEEVAVRSFGRLDRLMVKSAEPAARLTWMGILICPLNTCATVGKSTLLGASIPLFS